MSIPLRQPACARLLSFLLCAPIGASALLSASAVEQRRASASAAAAAPARLRVSSSSSARGNDLLTPQPNDTISELYYSKIDQAILAAQQTTPSPLATKLGVDMSSTTDGPYAAIAGASRVDTVTADQLTPNELASAEVSFNVLPKPNSISSAAGKVAGKQVSVVPYDMELGAKLMYKLTEKSQITSTPVPAQNIINEQFVAQCPMMMFANKLAITAPRCGQSMGLWADPTSARTLLRWNGASDSGVFFGVDSVVTGNGSVLFAEFKQEAALSGTNFQLKNCMGVKRYTVEEQVVKVDKIGDGISSTVQAHDSTRMGVAFFYKYLIKAPNGTVVAQSSLFRMNQNVVNVTMMNGEVVGPLVATAKRQGTWTQDQWRECTKNTRAWQVDFKISSRDLDSVATVQDIRVAIAATMTLMAFRAEAVSVQTGINRSGEANMAKQLLFAILFLMLALILLCACGSLWRYKGWDVKSKRMCFKIEKICMPAVPAWKRAPVFRATY
eukprot:TRINITY_DN47678_c0_g1_i1.p1 TRINITY_DN47678_c0_g1~~TRINITY_DN47678_c0_g1_i1.p1  ORF type:complete len:499 (+),score=103.24 TRINITY_DN47678_c0_g1_i1:91-1587(+)